MSFDELLESRMREIVREEMKAGLPKSELLFTPDELAKRWRMEDKQKRVKDHTYITYFAHVRSGG